MGATIIAIMAIAFILVIRNQSTEHASWDDKDFADLFHR